MTLAGSSLVLVGASACLHLHGQRGARNDAENRRVRTQACGPHADHVAVSGRSVDGDQTPRWCEAARRADVPVATRLLHIDGKPNRQDRRSRRLPGRGDRI